MTTPWERLQHEFVEDHRKMTRGYRELIDLLENRDFVGASHAASRLDTVAGPHIEFEEKYLYPHAAKTRGDTYLSRLFDEHDEMLEVLRQILHAAEDGATSDQSVQQWIVQLKNGIDHASACGTLLSELKTLSENEQLTFLDGLTRLRDQGARWSELHCHPKENL